MNREIPGFYYGQGISRYQKHASLIDVADPEKKKYFRIQASHKATPGSQYSKDAVKRKRDEQEVDLSRRK